MTNIPKARRLRSSSCSTTGLPSGFDVESLTEDSATLHVSLSLPPSLPAGRKRPTNTLPERDWRRRASLYLRHAWHQCNPWSWTSPDEEATAAVAEKAAAQSKGLCLGSVHDDHAPGAENSQPPPQQRKQPSQQGSDGGMGWTTGRGRRRGSCRSSSDLVRFKTLGRVCLAVIVAASTFNLFLACLSTTAGETSLRRGGLLSAVSDLLFSSSRRPTKDPGGIIFPEGFPAPRARIESRSRGTSYTHKESTSYPRRSTLDRVTEGGNALVSDQNGASETHTERVPPSVGEAYGLSQRVDQAPTTAGAQHDDRPDSKAAVAAADQFVVRHEKKSTPEGSIRKANEPQPPLYPDQFDGQRVAVVVPYIGRDLPVWWDAFAEQARLNDGLIDWILFCDEASFNFEPTFAVVVSR